MNPSPPRSATRLIYLFAPREGREEILGDLCERFLNVAGECGTAKAKRWYWVQALRSSRDFLKQKLRRLQIRKGHSGMKQGPIWEPMRSIATDIRYAFRSFRAHPGAILVAVASLGVGIGANVTVFSVVDVYMFRSLPFPEPDRLVQVYSTMPERGWNFNQVSIPMFIDFREQG